MLFRRIATVTVATGLAMLGYAGAAGATGGGHPPKEPPAPNVVVDTSVCGQVTLTLVNETGWEFKADYRVDGEDLTTPAAELDPGIEGLEIAEGPLAGQLFGPYGHVFTGATDPIVFDEDTGEHTVDYRIAYGAEQKLYADWQSVTVGSDCKENPPPSPSAELGDVQDCECEPPGWKATLDNPTKHEVVFSLDTIYGGTTDTVDVILAAGETVVSHVPGVEDTETVLRIRVGDLILQERTVTLDCAAPPTDEPKDPADPTDPKDPDPTDPAGNDDPPATTPPATTPPATTPPATNSVAPIGGGSDGGNDQKVPPVANDKLASTGSTFPVVETIVLGAMAVLTGAGATLLARRRQRQQ